MGLHAIIEADGAAGALASGDDAKPIGVVELIAREALRAEFTTTAIPASAHAVAPCAV